MKTPSFKFSLLDEAKKGELAKTYFGQILVFFGVFIVSTLLQSVIPCIFIWDEMIDAMSKSGINTSDSNEIYKFYTNYDLGNAFLLLSLFCTALGIITVFLYCRGFEKRKISSLGFVKHKALKSYSLGALCGFAMFSLSIVLCILLGGGQLNMQNNINITLIFAYLCGFIVQGMYEEVIFRGYFFISTACEKPIGYAIIANSVLFSLCHALNAGVSALAFFNIALFGVFMSLCMILTENIWFIAALHSFWNFTQGNIYGVKTSGMNMREAVFSFTPNSVPNWICGGKFGLEGSIAVTAVLIFGITALIFLIKKNRHCALRNNYPEKHNAD